MKKKLKLYALSVGAFLLLITVVLVAAEFIIRQSVLDSTDERRDHVYERPYLPVKMKPHYQGVFWKVPFKTNNYGFRDEPDMTDAVPAGRFRILSLGDSIGFGLGIPAADHYTKVLQRHLNAAGGPVDFHVVNAAGQGYSPSGYYVFMTHEGRNLQYDMMIVDIEMCTVVTNEAMLYWETDPAHPGVPERVVGGRYVVAWDGSMLATCATDDHFYEKTYVYTDFLRRWLTLLFRISPTEPFAHEQRDGVTYYNLGFDKYELDNDRLEGGWNKAFGAVKGLQELCEQRNVPFRVLIMPSRYMFEAQGGKRREFATALMKRGVARAAAEGLHYIDLTQAVRDGGGASLYYDFAHMTSQGNKVVGDALFRSFGPTLLDDVSSTGAEDGE